MKEKIVSLKNKLLPKLVKIKDQIKYFTFKNMHMIIILILIIIAVISIIAAGSKTKIGNTNGNLYNMGFSVKKNNNIYILDSMGEGIYKINKNGEEKEKITNEKAAYLNILGKNMYYLDTANYNIIRSKTNGQNKKIIAEGVDVAKVSVVDNWIYYFDDSNFYRIKTNGKNKTFLSDKVIENYEIAENWIYYAYKNDGKYIIAKMKLNGEKNTKIVDDAGEVFFINKNYIYYINEKYDYDNYKYSYELCRIKNNGKNIEKLAHIDEDLNVETINFTNKSIYYVKEDKDRNTAIYSRKLNGKEETKIVDIATYSTYINIHDNWIYYLDENENYEIKTFKIKINGESKQEI